MHQDCTWNKLTKYSSQFIIIINSIIIALDNTPYKILHELKSASSIRKNQLWTNASLSVSQKSQEKAKWGDRGIKWSLYRPIWQFLTKQKLFIYITAE